MVDCENSDPYKFVGLLKTLTDKSSRILLFDDSHTSSAWDYIQSAVTIPVTHCEVERVSERKSLVDIMVTAGVCREHYENGTKSFVLFSSDSDYWGLISSLPTANFFVVAERDKCGESTMQTLALNNVPYCFADDVCENIKDFKKVVLLGNLAEELPNIIGKNGRRLALNAFEKARIFPADGEVDAFFNEYVKKISLTLNTNGDFEAILPSTANKNFLS